MFDNTFCVWSDYGMALTAREELDRLKASRARERKQAKMMGQTLGGAGAGLGANTLATIAMARMPRLASIDAEGRIPTKAVVGVPLFFGGLAADGLGGSAAMFTGLLMVNDAVQSYARTSPLATG